MTNTTLDIPAGAGALTGATIEPMVDAATVTALPSRPGATAPAAGAAVARHARLRAGHDARVAGALAVLRAAQAAHPGRIVQASSLGAEDMVVTDLIARHGLPIDVATLDTGMLHAETLALVPRLEARYGLRVAVYRPAAEATVQFVARHGEWAMRESVDLRRACCAMRKLVPLQQMLEARTAWITGLRRDQSADRAQVGHSERDADGRAKFSPLADWGWDDVWHYIQRHDVPYNPLHDDFFPSIGCAPCTRAVAQGEDPRAGRWWWENGALKECGLHGGAHAGATPAAAPAGTPRADPKTPAERALHVPPTTSDATL